MPKGKYMIKIDALSGGEKSVAVLALILAFQNEKPSPVYYLDEVDMFLDGYNAEQVGKLFRENSKKAQVIMVSLKKAVSKICNKHNRCNHRWAWEYKNCGKIYGGGRWRKARFSGR